MDLIKNLFKGDPYIWGIYLTLLVISIVESFSATSFLAFRSAEHYSPAMSHFTHLLFGLITVFVVLNIKPHVFRVLASFAVLASIALLVAVFFTSKVNDASRYIFGFQPSELAKFSLICLVSSLLAGGQTTEGITKSAYKKILIFSILLCGLILPENFSTSALLASVVFFLMFLGRVQMKRLMKLVLVIVCLGILGLAYILYAPDNMLIRRAGTWRGRIERSRDETPKVDQAINDKNMQVQYGHMAVANGGIVGKGPGQSQIRDFLPLAFSDFIFSIILEEGGLIVGFFVLALYFLLLLRARMIFLRCENIFQAFLLLGLAMMIVFQALTNMAVGVDLIPVTGQPLPLLSRGGSSIIMTSIYFGIIQSVSRCVMESEEQKRQEQLEAERLLLAETTMETEDNYDDITSEEGEPSFDNDDEIYEEVYESEEEIYELETEVIEESEYESEETDKYNI